MTGGLRVAVIGAGALGSPMVQGLAAAQAAALIRVVDGDVVALSNLPRQPWYTEQDVGRPKVQALADPGQTVSPPWLESVPEMLTANNAHDLLEGMDLVLDGSDNWETRQAIEGWAWTVGKPWIFASALRWEGMTGLLQPGRACLRCLFGDETLDGPRCFESGVVGGLTLAVAGRALTILDWWGKNPADPALDRWWLVDGWTGRTTGIRRNERGCVHHGT
ncbi:MAG: ThiF family adenylyltransferase [Thermaerobacter sp.]|nr:ThiF family adenylyltransferase [Thermaerobacter sp.]